MNKQRLIALLQYIPDDMDIRIALDHKDKNQDTYMSCDFKECEIVMDDDAVDFPYALITFSAES